MNHFWDCAILSGRLNLRQWLVVIESEPNKRYTDLSLPSIERTYIIEKNCLTLPRDTRRRDREIALNSTGCVTPYEIAIVYIYVTNTRLQGTHTHLNTVAVIHRCYIYIYRCIHGYCVMCVCLCALYTCFVADLLQNKAHKNTLRCGT